MILLLNVESTVDATNHHKSGRSDCDRFWSSAEQHPAMVLFLSLVSAFPHFDRIAL